MEYLGMFLIVWVSTVNGVAITTAGPMSVDACNAAKIAAQSRASQTQSVTALCVGASQ